MKCVGWKVEVEGEVCWVEGGRWRVNCVGCREDGRWRVVCWVEVHDVFYVL